VYIASMKTTRLTTGRFRIDDTDTPTAVVGWTTISSVKLDPKASDSKKTAVEAWTGCERTLSELLQCDHLMVLAGLGTSLCIKDGDGNSLFPTMKDLWAKAKESVGDSAFDNILKHVNQPTGGNIEDLLSRCLMAVELSPKQNGNKTQTPDVPGFIKKAEETIRRACGKDLDVKATETHEEFLRRLTRRAPRRPRACLFTTNYDKCFETAAARIGLTVIDGFSFSAPPRFQPEMFDYDIITGSSYSKEPDFIPRLLRLFKLHGSVDWHLREGTIEKKADTDQPILIYPQSGKYAASYSPPFLEVMSRFQGMLRNRNVGLLIAFCGLNDRHIAEPVLAAVKSNTSLRVVVCAPDLCDAATTHPVLKQINQLIENGDNRLTLINGYFPDLVKLMPMLPLQTDAEQHESRLKALVDSLLAKQKADEGVGS
jgi:hypothetical protein